MWYANLQQQNVSVLEIFDEPDSHLPFIDVDGSPSSFVFGEIDAHHLSRLEVPLMIT